MPEWPDLHVLRERLAKRLEGRSITAVTLKEPIVVRATEDPGAMLVGRRFESVAHRGKFLLFTLDGGITIVLNPMLSGLLTVVPHGTKVKATTCVTLALDDGDDLRYLDDTKMGKLYLIRGETSSVPGLADLGADAGTLAWDDAEFARRVKAKRAAQVRNLLMDQTFIAGVGNAYADEILWEARIHPRRRAGSLGPEELAALRQAITGVLQWAAREVEERMPPELGVKPREFLKVRGQSKEPCPRCGTTLVLRHGGEKEMNFCPTCQPLEGSGPFGAPY